jgi:malyl-CoA/(S)-citramalyl-CoA lyase
MGGANPDYITLTHPDEEGRRERHWGDQWHFAISRMVVACRAYGLRPIDGPFGDIQDPDAYVAVSKAVAALGVEGKWAIHPSQIELANQVFTPPQVEVDRARRILVAMDEAAKEGRGAVALDGRLIDAASIRQAQVMVDKADQIEQSLAAR